MANQKTGGALLEQKSGLFFYSGVLVESQMNITLGAWIHVMEQLQPPFAIVLMLVFGLLYTA